MLREPPFVMLREHDRAVRDDIENAPVTFLKFDLQAKLVENFGRQTGGLRKVASGYAVNDRYLHGSCARIGGIRPQ